jgi:hypothetical protein
VRGLLAELALIEALAKAKAAGRRRPRAIARWILANPFLAPKVAQWVDLEGALTTRIEELEGAEEQI